MAVVCKQLNDYYWDTTPQILSSETLKTIQEFLNNGFVDRMKSLRVHLILCQTALNGESKEYFMEY